MDMSEMIFDFDATLFEASTSSIPFEWLPLGEVHRGELWYEDGNMIVQSGFTQFCVHEEMLLLSSSVLMDQISAVKLIDWGNDLPILFMEEEPHEILLLLQAIYLTEPQCIFDTATIRSLHLLGEKYDAPDVTFLAKQSISQLSSLANVLSDFMKSSCPSELEAVKGEPIHPITEPKDELEETTNRLLLLTSSPGGIEALKLVGEALKQMAEAERESPCTSELLKLQMPPPPGLFCLI